MALSSRKSSTVSDVFHSIIGAILFVSLCYASSGVTGYQFSPSTLNLANATSAKYLNQTVPTNSAKSRSKRSVVFPTGTDLTVTFAFQYPIVALTGSCKFVQNYDFNRKTFNGRQSVWYRAPAAWISFKSSTGQRIQISHDYWFLFGSNTNKIN